MSSFPYVPGADTPMGCPSPDPHAPLIRHARHSRGDQWANHLAENLPDKPLDCCVISATSILSDEESLVNTAIPADAPRWVAPCCNY